MKSFEKIALRILNKTVGEFPSAIAQGRQSFAEYLVNELQIRGETISFAESITGGLCGHLITNVADSGQVFKLSAVTYRGEMKTKLLEIAPEVVAENEAVNESCAVEMARGVQKISGATYGLSVTGFAGPSGKVGDAYFGISFPDGTAKAEHYIISTTEKAVDQIRVEIKEVAAHIVLALACLYCVPNAH